MGNREEWTSKGAIYRPIATPLPQTDKACNDGGDDGATARPQSDWRSTLSDPNEKDLTPHAEQIDPVDPDEMSPTLADLQKEKLIAELADPAITVKPFVKDWGVGPLDKDFRPLDHDRAVEEDIELNAPKVLSAQEPASFFASPTPKDNVSMVSEIPPVSAEKADGQSKESENENGKLISPATPSPTTGVTKQPVKV